MNTSDGWSIYSILIYYSKALYKSNVYYCIDSIELYLIYKYMGIQIVLLPPKCEIIVGALSMR